MKCKECEAEFSPVDIRRNSQETEWQCPTCKAWNDYLKQKGCSQSELNDVLCAFVDLAKDLAEEADAHIFTAKLFEIRAEECREASMMIRRKIDNLKESA